MVDEKEEQKVTRSYSAKTKKAEQMMPKLSTSLMTEFQDFESCSNLTDLDTSSGSEGSACDHGVRPPRFQSWLCHVLAVCSERLCASVFLICKMGLLGLL